MLGNLNKEYDGLYIMFCWLDHPASFIWEYGNGWEALDKLPN